MRDLPAVRPTVAEQITLACYQTEYGIFDHEAPHSNRPLAMVAMHDKEDVIEGGQLFSHIRKYHSHRVYKLFGINLIEFLELPPYVVELLYDMAAAEAVRTESTHRKLQQQLDLDFD